MNRKMQIIAASLSIMLLAGCGNAAQTGNISGNTSANISVSQISGSSVTDTSDMFSNRDYVTSYDAASGTVIKLNQNSAECSSDAVKISGSTVTITDEGTYILSGSLTDGMIIVNAENSDKVQLVLNGVSINSSSSAAVYVAQADKVFITLADNSVNTLSNGGTFTAIDDNNIDAAVFSKDDLTFNGSGKLTIISPAGHGVVSKDDLAVTGGVYTITAASQGLCGKESVRIADGTFTITAGKDGIHAEDADDTSLGFVYIAAGTYTITTEGDGISASGNLQVDSGSFTIQSGGGSDTVTLAPDGNWAWNRMGSNNSKNTAAASEDSVSAKGIKSTGKMVVNNGTFSIDSADDALHSNSDLAVNGGTFEIATGDDGIHADGTATVAGGTIVITKSYEGIEGENIVIAGGDINLTSSDDGLNAAGGNDQSANGGFAGFQGRGSQDAAGTSSNSSIVISGGKLVVNASGDGIDSNGALTVSGGETYVSGPTDSGNGALDYTTGATITGGIFVAAGSSGMAQNFGSDSTQGAMLVSTGSQNADTTITLADSNGTKILSWTPEKSFDCVVISCPDIVSGGTYKVTAGTMSQDVTMSSLIYGLSNMGGMNGGMNGGKAGKGNRGDMGNAPEPMGGTPGEMDSAGGRADIGL